MRGKLKLAMALLLLCSIANAFLLGRRAGAERSMQPLALPIRAGQWSGTNVAFAGPDAIRYGESLAREYASAGGGPVSILLIRDDGISHHPTVCFQAAGWELASAPAFSYRGGGISLDGFVGNRPGETLLVYHGFLTGGGVVAGQFRRKLLEVKQNIANGASRTYFVELSVKVENNDFAAAQARLSAFLSDFSSDLSSLSAN